MKSDLTDELLMVLKNSCSGRANAVKAQDLAKRLSASVREINNAVRQLRKKGVLIGSSKRVPYGYFLPATDQEVNDYLNAFKSELFDMLRTWQCQKKAVRAQRERHEKQLFRVDQSGQMCLK